MKFDLKQIIETLGVLGVIASLLFVGIQLQLERRLSLATVYQERAESRKEDLRFEMEIESSQGFDRAQIENGIFPNWWTEDVSRLYEQGGSSIAQLVYEWRRIQLNLIHVDNLVFQNELGLLDPQIVESVIARWRSAVINRNPLVLEALTREYIRSETTAILQRN